MKPPAGAPDRPGAPVDAEAYRALLRREQQIAAIQRSLGWRLLSHYGPYKRRFVLPMWRRVRGLVQRWLRSSAEHQPMEGYVHWARFSDRFRAAAWTGSHGSNRGASGPVSVSVVMTAEGLSRLALDAAASSMRAQHDVTWELCVALVDRTETEVRTDASRFVHPDSRIRIVADRFPSHATATNAAFALATGDVVAMMSPTAVLASDALCSAVRAFADTCADVLYSDEDLLDESGRRHSPQLKPGWSPDLLLSWMYWSRVVFYRRDFVERLMPISPQLGGAHAYDLALRAAEQPARIVHLPRILAHIASPPTATAGIPTAVELEAGRRAIEAAIARRAIAGSVHWHPEGEVYRVQRTVTSPSKVSIIIPTRDGLAMLRRCLRAVEATEHPSYEIVLVDNGSVESATLAFLDASPHRVLRMPGPFNFSRLNNHAAAQTDGDYLLFLNDDTEPCRSDWLRALEEHAQRPEVGAVGAKLLYSNGRIQHAGIALGIGGLAGHPYRFQASAPEGIRNVSAVTAACLMMRRETFDAVGGFDERLPVNSNDVDLCLRLRERGYLVIYTPHAVLHHHESQTRGARATPDDAWHMTRRWRDVLGADPYYNPNADLAEESASMDLSKPDGMVRLHGGMGLGEGSLRVEPGATGGQRFFATGSDLCAIVVRVLIEAENPETALRLTIRDAPTSFENVRIVERSILGRTDDERWFCFEPLADSADRFWYFFLEVVDGRACTLRRTAMISDVMGPCFEAHTPTHGTLSFELYARAPYRCATSPP